MGLGSASFRVSGALGQAQPLLGVALADGRVVDMLSAVNGGDSFSPDCRGIQDSGGLTLHGLLPPKWSYA